MADATEYLQPPSSSSSNIPSHDEDHPFDSPAHDASDSEAEDIAPNFLNLSLSTSSKAQDSIPKRGLKDFEANPTLLQSRTLAASRQAMHDALSHMRVHPPRDEVVGIYDEASGETFVSRTRARGKIFSTMGRWRRGNICGEQKAQGGDVEAGYILGPEEALWALESGRLDVRYSGVMDDALSGGEEEEKSSRRDDSDGETAEESGMPMSLQGAYAAYIGDEPLRGGKLTLERYIVYTALRRAGYIVTRAEGWDGRKTQPPRVETAVEKSQGQTNTEARSLFTWLYEVLFTRKPETEGERHARQRIGPLVSPGLYRSYNDIYRVLQLVQPHTSRDVSREHDDSDSPFTTTYNVYKASPGFRKSAPGPPDFRICVISARETTLPTLVQLSQLIDEQPPLVAPGVSEKPSLTPDNGGLDSSNESRQSQSIAPANTTNSTRGAPERGTKRRELDPRFAAPNTGTVGHMYGRLKRGHRNIILAIVDEGIVSYLRFGDAGFDEEKLFERAAGKRGGKGGGRGQGRGRGRGRG